VDIRGLGTIPRILFATDGTITHILEAYAGEPVDLVRLSSTMAVDAAHRHRIGIQGDERALRRLSLRQGRHSRCVFVHADSIVVLDRLPEEVADELVETGASLLELLAHHRIGTFRESTAEWEGRDEQVAAHFGIDPAAIHVARTYHIVLGGRPVAWVTESFPKHGFASPPPGPAEVSRGTAGPTQVRRWQSERSGSP